MNSSEQIFTVHTPHGVHGRIAARLALIAAAHEVRIHILDGSGYIDCSSVLDVLSQAFTYGTRITVRVQGEQYLSALFAVEKLLSGGEEP
jgi:multiphosphoryl transfer protein